jgi:hypothetical protein
MGRFNITVLSCNICMFFFYIFCGVTGLLLCLNTSWSCSIYVRGYRLCSLLHRSLWLNNFHYSNGPGNTVQRMDFFLIMFASIYFGKQCYDVNSDLCQIAAGVLRIT